MIECLYCDNQLDGSSEHILQNCLGCEWEEKNILCSECNGLFGNTIDKNICDNFGYFLNFLGIRGKKKTIRYIELISPDGTVYTRNGETGELIGKPTITPVKQDDKIAKFKISTHPSEYEKIVKSINKSIKKDGMKLEEGVIEEYISKIGTPLSHKFTFSIQLYMALFKSLINFWGFNAKNGERNTIFESGKKVKSFAIFLEEARKKDYNEQKIIECAQNLGLPNGPLIMEVPQPIMKKIKGERKVCHFMLLAPKDDGLYGGICLFNEIMFGFKLSSKREYKPALVVFDPQNGSHDLNKNFEDIKIEDIKFVTVDPTLYTIMVKKFIEQIMPLCLENDIRLALNDIISLGEISRHCPITDKKAIYNFLESRTSLFLHFALTQYISPAHDDFETIKKVFAHIMTNTILENVESEGMPLILDENLYTSFIYCVVNTFDFIAPIVELAIHNPGSN